MVKCMICNLVALFDLYFPNFSKRSGSHLPVKEGMLAASYAS